MMRDGAMVSQSARSVVCVYIDDVVFEVRVDGWMGFAATRVFRCARARAHIAAAGKPRAVLSRPDGSADRRRRGGDVDATAVTTEDLKLK
jgi:hypothetical protein